LESYFKIPKEKRKKRGREEGGMEEGRTQEREGGKEGENDRVV
jgi:hypothetical protein